MSRFLPLLALSLLGVAAGVSAVVQQVLNANLRTNIGSPSWAALASYVGGTLTMFVVLLAMREPLPAAGAMTNTLVWSWTGGIFGAVFIFLSILLVPRLGSATVIAVVVAGQMLTSILLDHFGAFGLPEHPIDVFRLAGAAMLIVGAVLIQH